MKNFTFLVLFMAFVTVSCQYGGTASSNKPANDTIQTASGLKYLYLKKGDGPKIVSGARVGTYLSLMVNDSVVWNTNELPDSLFTFIADSTRLIKGFTEVSMLLREGDEIIAILPDSLAYGAKGAGDIIPPNATLVYDQFKVMSVVLPDSTLVVE
ncbi:FKBP-type peptidyl-prolyl cis-trans isomerase [Carboxylicivirga sediminis]|uniref:Peptidyl-prolyl cis-trans isomerase n=1 Tax=Carboxylicivirga sediminis TaxID=2006564 RepID=A0A941FBU8_9BACT|nr:FKBP-type peptidyl-prolyl cis-trans isomerase [Carboxylicivirga sediminis]MBR8537995.1 FKBP-type peptidyl-prolyl cis-trans isomerase [Carboxylicivirga sediminis]